jgi:hypothetical protein
MVLVIVSQCLNGGWPIHQGTARPPDARLKLPAFSFQVLTGILLLVQLQACQPSWGRRITNTASDAGKPERQPCPQVTSLTEANRLDCVSKYDCAEVCEEKKKCRTQYEYKCTDFKRRECKEVWQNQCNGLDANKRKKQQQQARGRRAIRGNGGGGDATWDGDFSGRRTRRLIPTEVVYDQNYPLPDSDLPFADPVVGRTRTCVFHCPFLSSSIEGKGRMVMCFSTLCRT